MQGIASGGAELLRDRINGLEGKAAIEGYLAGLSGEKVPANQRLPIPYEDLDRLAYWQAHRMGSTAVKERLRNGRRKFWRFTVVCG